MSFPLVSCSSVTLAFSASAFCHLAHPVMAHDLGHSGLPAQRLFYCQAYPFSDGNLGRGGDGAQGDGRLCTTAASERKKVGMRLWDCVKKQQKTRCLDLRDLSSSPHVASDQLEDLRQFFHH